jgi:hypothetical protein
MEETLVRFDDRIEYHNKNGVLHRTDGPAYIKDDYEVWYYNGLVHRTDGPAFISKSVNIYYILGKKYGKFITEEYTNEVIRLKLEKLKNL